MSLQIKRQPLNLEELVKKSFRWHFLPSELCHCHKTKQFASISIDLEIKFCLKTNLDFFPWQIPQRQRDGASLGICRIESLICRNSTQLDFNRTICRWKSWHGAHYSTQIRRKKLNQLGISCKISASQSVTWRPLSLVAEVRAVGGKQHLSQLQGGAYWV